MVAITLFCLQDGEATSRVFSIDINPEKSVAHLKDLIKAKKTIDFSDIDSDKLTLWRVSISNPDDDDDNLSILLDNVRDEDKKKLKSSTKLSKVFDTDPPEETIHVIVQRPPSAAESPTVATFSVTVKGRTPSTLKWITNTTTATLDELRDNICTKHPSLSNPSLNNGPRAVAIDNSDCDTVLYLESDEELRTHLRSILRDGVQHLSVRLEGRPRPFSEFTLTETNRIYGDEYPKDLGGAGSTPLTSPGYIQAVSDLLDTLRSAVKAMWPGKSMCPEPGYSLYVALFLIHAVGLFPELILAQNEAISGRRGSGHLDYAIISKDDPSRMLAVTTSGLMEGNSLSQNMVQLDTIASGRKRKFDDDDDDSAPVISYGIVSDASTWSFLECNTDRLHRSGYNDPTFTVTQSQTILQFSNGSDNWETNAKEIFGHIVYQLQKLVDDIPNRHKRFKVQQQK